MYYTGNEISARVKQVAGRSLPQQEIWLCFIRKSPDEQKPNQFNDLAYVMKGNKIIGEYTCTTVPGLPALQGGYRKYNKKGAAVICADTWMEKAFKKGLHNGKMKCLRQVKPIWTTRDGNGNAIAEEYGKKEYGRWYTNIHGSTYNRLSKLIRKFVGQWSYGCIVFNNNVEYYKFLDQVGDQAVSAIVLNEFSV